MTRNEQIEVIQGIVNLLDQEQVREVFRLMLTNLTTKQKDIILLYCKKNLFEDYICSMEENGLIGTE